MAIISKIKQCTECFDELPFAPQPILQYSKNAKIVIIGQAPGIKAHQTQKPWNDASGVRLRNWLMMNEATFYDKNILSIIPMGFCYPGKGKSGDLPPRPECAPKWHPLLIDTGKPKLSLLIGKYAQDFYLEDKRNLTERLRNWEDYAPRYLVLPHPSPRNNIWLKKHDWFEQQVLPIMQNIIRKQLLENT